MHKTKIALRIATIAILTAGCSSGDGEPGAESTSCSVEENDDGTVTIECPDGSSVIVSQGGDGAPGADGKDGENGDNGEQGTNGENGAPGEDGETGQEGSQGDPGTVGPPGEDGEDGEPGLPGDAGTSCSVECVDASTARIFCEDGNEVRYEVDSCRMAPVSLLSARGYHGCWILPSDRRLACWGFEGTWGLGNGPSESNQESPNLVDTLKLEDGLDTRWRSVDTNTFSSCGITVGGAGYCWGSDPLVLGNGGLAASAGTVPTPVDVSGLPAGTTWYVISPGSDSGLACGITSHGTAYCWGSGASGRLGNGSNNGNYSSPSAVDISGLSPETIWTAISAGSTHACGLTSDGEVYCWGADSNGRLGNGSGVSADQVSPSAVDLTGLPLDTTWTAISAGTAHVCALTSEGEAYCWGSDEYGQLGNDALGEASSPSPVDMSALPDGVTFTQLSAGEQHTCGLASDGSAWCWGNRSSGQLGDGSADGSAPSPVGVDVSALPGGTTWKALSAGGMITCGLTTKGEVYCWGDDYFGELGNGAAVSETQLQPEYPVNLSIGVLLGESAFSGAVEATNPQRELIVLPMDGSDEALTVTATSSDEGIVPNANITVLGTGSERSLSLEPIASGLCSITVVVASSEDEYSFMFTYGASPEPADPAGLYHHHISDASTAIDVGGGYMLLGSDATNVVALYAQDTPGLPFKVWDFTTPFQLADTTIGVEAAARSGDTIVWASSHANRLGNGAPQESQRVIFATTITGSGADVELSFSGRYGGGLGSPNDLALLGLWMDLITWDQTNGHGAGANALGFEAAAASGVVPTAPSGFSIEGLEFAADGTTGYLGFRAPTIDVSGTQHALIVPVTNLLELVAGIGDQSGQGAFGAPILLNLAGRSIRDIRRSTSGEYLLVAGPPDGATSGVNDTWALYTWAGVGQPAVFNRELPNPSSSSGGAWESIARVPNPLQAGGNVRLVTDSGATVFYGSGETTGLGLGLQKSYSQVFPLN